LHTENAERTLPMPTNLRTVEDALARIKTLRHDLDRLNDALADEITVPSYGEMDEQMEYADAIAAAVMEAGRKLQDADVEMRAVEMNLNDLAEIEERGE
jgi:hypothetical protein